MTRALAAIAVAALVVLAGCGAVFGDSGGGDEPASTVTPMAVPTDEPTPEPTPGPNTTLAPGLTGAGIENATALVAAHASFLQNRSFTTISNTTMLAPNGSVTLRTVRTLRAGPPGEGVHSVGTQNGSYPHSNEAAPNRTEVWTSGKRLLIRQSYPNGTATYDRFETAPRGRYGTGRLFFAEQFGTDNTTVTARERDGTTLYLVRGSISEEDMGNMSLRMLVDSQGMIHRYRAVRRIASDENVSKYISEKRFLRVGTTDAPERPSWIDEALNRTTPVSERTTTPTNTSSAPRLAPGLTEAGIADANTLVGAHISALENRSFAVRSNDTSFALNGTVLARSTSTLRMEPRGEGFRFVVDKNGTDGYVRRAGSSIHTELWSNGSRVFITQRYANGTAVYRRLQTNAGPFREYLLERGLHVLDSFDTANTGVMERVPRNGTTLYRVNGSARSDEWRTVDLDLIVDSRGVVREVGTVRNGSLTNNAPKVVTNTQYFGFSATDVERPSWVDEAMNRTTSMSGRPTVTPTATSAANRTGTTSNGTTSVSATTSSG
jgi:hypothetical protein